MSIETSEVFRSNQSQCVVTFPPHSFETPGLFGLTLSLYGDEVVGAAAEFGFTSRAVIPRTLVQLENEFLDRALQVFEHLEPESALILGQLLAECIEKQKSIDVPARAAWIREGVALVCELLDALRFQAQMAEVMELSVAAQIIRKHREELLDLIELMTGSRYGYAFIRVGGVRHDLTEGSLEKLEKWCVRMIQDVPRIEALMLWTHGFHQRLSSIGRVLDEGRVGFISRSATETTQYGFVSSVGSRLIYSFESIRSRIAEVRQLLEKNIQGVVMAIPNPSSQSGVAESQLDTYRGLWSVRVEASKSIQVQTPSEVALPFLSKALVGENFDDVPLVLASLNIRPEELDQ